jgi:hypothetical protein
VHRLGEQLIRQGGRALLGAVEPVKLRVHVSLPAY